MFIPRSLPPTNPRMRPFAKAFGVRGCSIASNGESLAADSSSPLTCVRSCELHLALRLPSSLQSRFWLRCALSSQYDHVNAVQSGHQDRSEERRVGKEWKLR